MAVGHLVRFEFPVGQVAEFSNGFGKDFFERFLAPDTEVTLRGAGRRPRVHDLRHTYAVTALASMADTGIDLYVSLPILSNYLGHQSLEATNYYVRLTANMFPGLLKDVDLFCLNVFPKFQNDETN